MKTTLFALALTLVNSMMNSAVAGPSVSGGVVYYKQHEVCKTKESALTISEVLRPGNIVSTISEGPYTTSLTCTKTTGMISPKTGEEMLWNCEEHRAGEGQLRIHVLRANNGVKYAAVYRLDILNRLADIYQMKCDQQVSN